MGASVGCCSVAVSSPEDGRPPLSALSPNSARGFRSEGSGYRSEGGGRGRRSSVVASLPGARDAQDYKKHYKEKGPLDKKTPNVLTVVSTEHQGQYVCRRLKVSEIPCDNKVLMNHHINALNSFDHPHACKFIEAFESTEHMFLIYEKANPTQLSEHIRLKGSLCEEECADYLRQCAMALSVAHSQGIYHGRLSPKSIILADTDEDDDEESDAQIKICDMGQGFIWRPSIVDLPDSDKALAVQKYAMTPELATGDLDSSGGGAPSGAGKCDVWALGVTFYHLLAGTTPFKVTGKESLKKTLGEEELQFNGSLWNKLTLEARDIIEQMMRLHPSIRIPACKILKHPWVQVARATFPRKRMVALLQSMASNTQESEFKRFVLRVVASQLPQDSKHLHTVETAFRCLDRNGDGILSVQEVVAGLKKHLGDYYADEELESLFGQVDRDGSGTINVPEFVSASMSQSRSTSLPVLWEAFNALDKDRSAIITFDEIDGIVRQIEGAMLSQSQVSIMCEEIRNELQSVSTGDNIDFDQFVYIMIHPNPNLADTMSRDVTRFLWDRCGVDSHGVRHVEVPRRWDLSQTSPKGSRSVYRRRENNRRGSADMGSAELSPDKAG